MKKLLIVLLLFGCTSQSIEQSGIRYMLYDMQEDILYNEFLTPKERIAKYLTYLMFSVPLALMDYNAPPVEPCKQVWTNNGILTYKCYTPKQVDFCSQQFPNNLFEQNNCRIILGN